MAEIRNSLSPTQELVLLKQLISIVVQDEVHKLRKNPSLLTLESLPFLKFMFNNFLAKFPWFKEGDDTFWGRIEEFLEQLQTLQLSNSHQRGEDTHTDELIQRFHSLIVLLYKNILRSPSASSSSISFFSTLRESQPVLQNTEIDDDEDDPLEEEENEAGMDEDFECNIIAARDITENNEKYTAFIVDTRIGRRRGRIAHRYSNFELFHSTVSHQSRLKQDQSFHSCSLSPFFLFTLQSTFSSN
jgi:hypothetical protein